MKKLSMILLSLSLIFVVFPLTSLGFNGEVNVGQGSYSEVLPPGATNIQSAIYKTSNVTGPMPTNDWWSSTAFQAYSERQYPHPLAVWNQSNGLRIFNPSPEIEGLNGFIKGWMGETDGNDFTVGHSNVGAFPDTKVDSYSDWFVTNLFASGSNTMKVTYGHGSPYVYFTYSGGNPRLTFPGTPSVWSGNTNSPVLGITINNRHYALFGPSGSTWSGIGSSTLTNNLNGNDYFSIAALPDNSVSTLNKFTQYAYSHVTDTLVSWSYNENTSQVTTTYTYTTVQKQGSQTGTIFALYPHQWKNTSKSLLSYTYDSVRGMMKVAEGNSFQTNMTFTGVIPAIPDLGTYDMSVLAGYVNEAEDEVYSGLIDTYWVGKRLGKITTLATIADQVGDTTAANKFRNEIKDRLEDWFKASEPGGNLGSTEVFYYNDNWGTMFGYPDSYGSVTDLNDHHFHYGYFIRSAAEIARLDSNWSSTSNWGGMVDLLIRDIASDDRNDNMFPFLRNFDIYAGHSWASGNANFGDGNNNESSSEGMNAWTGMILWGEATGDTALRDLGIYLYTTEMNAINEYWFDVTGQNHHAGFNRETASMLWGGKTVGDGVWWTGNPEEIHGINWLPFQSGSLYLTQFPAYTELNYNALINENGGTNWDAWEDLIWMYRAIEDPADALSQYNARANVFTPEAGNSKANTYHWIHNLNAIGTVDTSITADYPLYAVFKKGSTMTYIAYNMSNSVKTVNFSDGTSIVVQPNSFNIGNGQADTTPPSQPTNVIVTTTTSSSISLSWNASTDNVGVTGYDVYRDGSLVGTSVTTSYTDNGLTANTTYSYTVIAKDGAGNSSTASSAVQGTTDQSNDQTPPSQPGNVVVTGTTSDSVSLSWSASTDNEGVIGYEVYRDGSLAGTSSTTSYTDNGLTANTTYSYTVIAKDAAGNSSTASSAVQATTSNAGSGNVIVENDYTIEMVETNANTALFKFTPTSGTSSFVDLHYKVNNGGQINVGTVNNGGVWEYSITGLNQGDVIDFWYTYTIGMPAYNSPHYQFTFGFGGGGQPDTTPPTTPSLNSTGQSDTTVDLSWSASTDNVGVTGYKVYRDGSEVGSTSSTSFQDTGLSSSTSYNYTVIALDAAGNESASSNTVTVTTDAPSGNTIIVTDNYTIEIQSLNSTSALFKFTPNAGSNFVDLHYTVDNGVQLNVATSNNGGTWEYTVNGLNAGSHVNFFYTFTIGTPAYDTPHYGYDH
ncbi:glycosyl hydrolase [Chengkuizengella sp. SCS-71B]|uniref:glycosyl hydrolase n=1 Tax=Chengkuizengella sp. SCS-71B TaxID=3115290 RepID=UPI0032C2116A